MFEIAPEIHKKAKMVISECKRPHIIKSICHWSQIAVEQEHFTQNRRL